MANIRLGVFIGRFQPPTKAHEAILRQVHAENDHAVIFVGSNNRARSIRNPFTAEERRAMIMDVLPKTGASSTVSGISDFTYNINDWVKNIQTKIDAVTAEIPGTNNNIKIALYGFFKDNSSYYLNHFPQWELRTLDEQENGLSSTDVRKILYEIPYMSKDNVQKSVTELAKILNPKILEKVISFAEEDRFKLIAGENRFIIDYKSKWLSAPFPPTFNSVNAIVIQNEKILLIKRGKAPGRDLYAIPGGFLNQNDFIRNAAIKKLKEETGIEASNEILNKAYIKIKAYDDPYRDHRGRLIAHVHLFDFDASLDLNQPELNFTSANTAGEVLWMPLADFYNKACEFYSDHWMIIYNILSERK